MPTMPTGLVPNVSAYSFDEPGGVMRTEVMGGASRFAQQWARGPQRFNITILMDAQQFAAWTMFYHHIISKGAIAFDMRIDSGLGVAPHSCNIMPGSYSAARTGGIATVVSFVVEAENKVYEVSAADAAAYIEFFNGVGGVGDELLERIEQFATVDTLVLDL